MKLKHKLIKEFQYLGDDKKIIVLKVGTILEEYIYKLKSELIPIDKDIVDSNPDFFEIIDWKSELLTYIKSNKRTHYLSLVTDVFSRKIVGYHLSDDMSAENVVKALKMAVKNRKTNLQLIHHSDRGLQYCSQIYQNELQLPLGFYCSKFQITFQYRLNLYRYLGRSQNCQHF